MAAAAAAGADGGLVSLARVPLAVRSESQVLSRGPSDVGREVGPRGLAAAKIPGHAMDARTYGPCSRSTRHCSLVITIPRCRDASHSRETINERCAERGCRDERAFPSSPGEPGVLIRRYRPKSRRLEDNRQRAARAAQYRRSDGSAMMPAIIARSRV